MATTPPLRKDAARNRAALIEAAARTFRDHGLGASVNAVAAEAGVNVATLYRHFPAKEDLQAAVLVELLRPLAAARDAALAEPGTGATLAAFLRAALQAQAEHRGLGELLTARAGADLRARLRATAEELVAPVVDRAHEEGTLRADLGPLHLLVTMRMLGGLVTLEGRPHEDAEVYLGVLLRGLR